MPRPHGEICDRRGAPIDLPPHLADVFHVEHRCRDSDLSLSDAPASRRRLVRAAIGRKTRSTPLLWASVCAAALGTLLLWHFAHQGYLHSVLGLRGVPGNALVEGIFGLPGDRLSRPVLVLRFTDLAGRSHLVRRSVRTRDYRVGEEVSVVYDREQPTRFLLADQLRATPDMREMAFVGGAGCVLVALGYPRVINRLLRGQHGGREELQGA